MFKVGDLITGIFPTINPYGVISHESICEVMEVLYNGYIRVKLISSSDPITSLDTGKEWVVASSFFKLVNESKSDKFEFHKKRVEERHLLYASNS